MGDAIGITAGFIFGGVAGFALAALARSTKLATTLAKINIYKSALEGIAREEGEETKAWLAQQALIQADEFEKNAGKL